MSTKHTTTPRPFALDTLEHRVRDLDLLCAEYRARIKRLANRVTYLERQLKQARKEVFLEQDAE
jgi:hypothetical protein